MLVIYEEYSVDLLIEGGGFPAFWYCLGYGKQYIKQNKPKLIAGYSSGSIVAVLLLFPELNILDILETYVSYIHCCNIFSLEYCVRNMMNDILPEDAYKLANGKIGIILCEPHNYNKCKMVIHWNNNEELIDCLVASCYNPCIMNGICSHTDNKYNCRDAIYSCDLQTFINNFQVVIAKPRMYRGILDFINNFFPLSAENAIILFEQGVNNFTSQP
jgi:hypothetical protein